MSVFINVSVTELVSERTSHSSKVRITVSKQNSSYFGLCDERRYLAFMFRNNSTGETRYYKHWGFPIKWKSSWGVPSWRLTDGKNHDIGLGSLPSYMGDSYTWDETINIDRGDSLQGSAEIEAGVISGPGVESRFGTTLQRVKVKTTSIPKVDNISFDVFETTENEERYICIRGSMRNYENYYTAKVYSDKGTVEIYSTKENSFEIKERIPKYSEAFSKNYVLKIFGKNNALFYTSEEKNVDVKATGVGVYLNDSLPKEVENMEFKNVNHKEITEVWIKDNGKIYRTVK